MSSIRELDEREFEFRDSTEEVLDYWHTLRVTNTHSDKTRAHGLNYFSNNDKNREEFIEEGSEDLEVVEGTVENWLDEFEEEGLLERRQVDEQEMYETTLEGRVMEEGLNMYAGWIAENHPVTEQEMKRAALNGIFDEWNMKTDAEELNPDEYIDQWEGTDKLHENVANSVNVSNSYAEAIQVMNELEGDRMEILGLFLHRPEEEAMQVVEDGNYCIKTGQGAKTYIKRMMEEREIVEKTEERYELNDKGKKAIETLKFQSQMLEYGRQADEIGQFVNNLKKSNLVKNMQIT